METTYSSSQRAGFFTFFWTVFVTTGIALLIMWLCGGYMFGSFARPNIMMPAAAVYSLDAAARLLYGLCLYLTARAAIAEGTSLPAKQASTVLWIIAYTMSIALLPVLFVFKWYLFAFIWMIGTIGVTTAQFIVNFKVSVGAALTVLPYWGLLIYGACVLFMIL